jgi:hypothetical protein
LKKLDRLGSSDLSLRIPFCPGIRYIPGKPLLRKNRGLGSVDDTDQVPDASRLSPPRIGADHPDAATLYLHGSLDADEVALRTLSSPSHPALIRPAEALLEVELAGEQHVPDRDFILRWQETAAAAAKPKAWVSLHRDPASGSDHRYALLQVRAPQLEAVAAAADDFAQDIYFLLDRSGSMAGGNWEQAAIALHAFVRQLGARDRVWLTALRATTRTSPTCPCPAMKSWLTPAFKTSPPSVLMAALSCCPPSGMCSPSAPPLARNAPPASSSSPTAKWATRLKSTASCASPSNPGYPCTASASTAR